MKEWKVIITKDAKEDIQKIHRYIALEAFEPDFADDQVRRIHMRIFGLKNMPFKYKQFDMEPWKSIGYRILNVDRYVVFFHPVEDLDRIVVTNVIHSSQDIIQALLRMKR